MAVLHEYVPSSDKSGLYIRDGIDGNIVTYQLSRTAENLLRGLEYKNGDQISQELINLLHRLRLIYTHRSGIEPPKSLRDLTGFKDNEMTNLSSRGRGDILQFLLDHASLNEDEQAEVLEYAHRTDSDVAEREVDEGQHTASSSSNGDLSPSDDSDKQSKNSGKEKSLLHNNIKDKDLLQLEIECEYCDEIISATRYVEHVRQSDSRHGAVGSFPEHFFSEHASIIETTAADVLLINPNDFGNKFEYYPICRQCGKRFVLLGSYQVHKNSTRRNVDESLHNRNTERNNRPLLIPFTSDRQVAIAESRLAEEVTEVALSKLNFDNTESSNEYTESKFSEKDKRSPNDSNEKQFEERIIEYECAWVLTDLTRFLTVLGRHHKNEEVSELISDHYEGIMEHAQKYYDKTNELPGSLNEYQTQWKRPEISVRVPREVLKRIGVGDYRGEIYLPPGYCYPIIEIHQQLETAWIEQMYPDKNGDDTPLTVADDETMSIVNSDQHDQVRSNKNKINDGIYVPLSTVDNVLSEYEEHERDGRQASWFHAAEILRQIITEETGFEIENKKSDE